MARHNATDALLADLEKTRKRLARMMADTGDTDIFRGLAKSQAELARSRAALLSEARQAAKAAEKAASSLTDEERIAAVFAELPPHRQRDLLQELARVYNEEAA